jgi:hypothetical protein
VIALLIWQQNLLTTAMTAAVILSYGLAILYLAGVLRKIYGLYPEAGRPPEGDVELSTDQAMLLVMGVFMLLLGILLTPANLGLLPFSGSAQLGLLMVMFAVQMLASGSTPIGPFPRSWLMIVCGLLFAAPGIVSCIIPEILVLPLTVLVGVLNILGGVITLWQICLPRLRKPEAPPGPVLPIMNKLFAAQLTMNLLTILFGSAMLVSNLVPGAIMGVVLGANGCVLLYLLHIMMVLAKLQGQGPVPGDPPKLQSAMADE